MNADLLIRGVSQLVTPLATGPVHGRAMRELRIVADAAIAVRGDVILWAGSASEWRGHAASELDCGQRAILPALVDPHTHAVWAGDRLNDFDARVSGVDYEQILAAGGGIRSTVRHTASRTPEQLAALARPRIDALLRSGAATIEVKSGYGGEPEAEIRMLEAISILERQTPARIVPTLLIHIPPREAARRAAYLEQVKRRLIPEVVKRKLAHALDVFVEREAWTAAEAEELILCGHEHGLRAKLHTEQFHRVGGLELGVRHGALSIDHLEVAAPSQIPIVAASSTVATLLPGVTLHLGIAAAPGRQFVDGNVAVAVGTDLNPGSSPLFSAQAALALAVRLNCLTPAEALTACTVNAAAALDLSDRGRLTAGSRADFLVLQSSDWRDIAYVLGSNPIAEVWVGGRKAAGKEPQD